MEKKAELTEQVLGKQITVTAFSVGDDLYANISGGDKSHIGSVSLVEYTPSLQARGLQLESHRDQVVSDFYAAQLSLYGHCTVCVTCGIHYEQASKDDIERIIDCTNRLLKQLIFQLYGISADFDTSCRL